jgi:gamma-glutamylcyclotransferase (GGCT)/AIG2-like uncharacterized protein YtfP
VPRGTRIFAYGTLREPAILRHVAGTTAPLDRAVPAVLRGWRRVPLAGTPYETLARAPGGRVDGLLLEVGRAQLARLHRYEGPLYRFRPVHVTVGTVRVPARAWIADTPAETA